MKAEYDIIISGGGMTGASLAYSLRHLGLSIAVIETFPINQQHQPSYDDRALALSYGSKQIFHKMDVWKILKPHATAIRNIHVSDRGHFGFTRINASKEGVAALGYVCTAKNMGQALVSAISETPNIDYLCPATVQKIETKSDSVSITINDNQHQKTLKSRLLVAADGADSFIRHQLKIPTRLRDYHQTAIIANVTPEKPHQNVAYERFTANGSLALLPMQDNHCSLVRTVSSEQAGAYLELSDEAFLDLLFQTFGKRLGKFVNISQRQSYPLKLIQAKSLTCNRVILVGNAAHAIHPVAGQGFNLGLRDIQVLAKLIASSPHDPGNKSLLAQYQKAREKDHSRMIYLTNLFINTFTNPLPPIAVVRNTAMVTLDLLTPLKHQFARATMGLFKTQRL